MDSLFGCQNMKRVFVTAAEWFFTILVFEIMAVFIKVRSCVAAIALSSCFFYLDLLIVVWRMLNFFHLWLKVFSVSKVKCQRNGCGSLALLAISVCDEGAAVWKQKQVISNLGLFLEKVSPRDSQKACGRRVHWFKNISVV